ncbi:MAG: hypothetical protein HZB68_00785 [Candidatus Aenigmarchaeota archaeon]|nr:hypothetical protein [Candidatus Aenigmarchaeota archaeon]
MEIDKRILAVLLAFIALAAVFLFPSGKKTFSPIEGIPYLYTDGASVLVNSSEECASYGTRCYVERSNTRYRDRGFDATLFTSGIYKGNRTGAVYASSGKRVLEISQYIKPSDGVINGYISFSVRDGFIVAKAFIDDDWKKLLGNATIVWGGRWEHSKPFEFNEVYPGVYVDTVYDNDTSRFLPNRMVSDGNFAVTDASPDEFRKGAMDGKTAIIYR